MPKITFIKNVENEVIYPKTHEDAILTKDGVSIADKLQAIYDASVGKADNNHTHDYNDLINIPTVTIADGGNADTVNGVSVDDTAYDTKHLWTAFKINNEIQLVKNFTSNVSDLSIYVGDIEPPNKIFWIDSRNNVFKYKIADEWITLGTELRFQ